MGVSPCVACFFLFRTHILRGYVSFREGTTFQPFFCCCATFHLPGTTQKHRGFEDFLTQETLKVRIDPLSWCCCCRYEATPKWVGGFFRYVFSTCSTLTDWEKLDHIDPIWWKCFFIIFQFSWTHQSCMNLFKLNWPAISQSSQKDIFSKRIRQL